MSGRYIHVGISLMAFAIVASGIILANFSSINTEVDPARSQKDAAVETQPKFA